MEMVTTTATTKGEEALMFSHLMLATDFSLPAHMAAGFTHELASSFPARVTLAHVCAPGGPFDEAAARQSLELLRAERFADVAQVEIATPKGDAAAYALAELARARDVDLIVAGRHGAHAISERLIGTVTERVVRHAPCSVLVVQPAGRERLVMVKHIMVATDFSTHARSAVRTAATLARRLGAFVTLAHVYDLFPTTELLNEPYAGHSDHSFEGMLRDKLEQLRKDELDGVPAEVQVLRDKSTVRAITNFVTSNFVSDRQVDLLVVGTHGLTGLSRLLLGSVAERLVRHAQCSVLVTRP
jgi:nucleotide-binding universal stress UspA family protein